MNKIVDFNRKTLQQVENWIKKEDWDIPNSVFNYGLPDYIFHFINLPISNDLTEADKICEFIDMLQGNINYLEIGVSVGKTFYQILQYAKSHAKQYTISCLDIEKINPSLQHLLGEEYETHSIPSNPPTDSYRKDPQNHIKTWNSHKVTYYEADEFDDTIWKTMNTKYNLIFSDALHNPGALYKEYSNLRINNLLDDAGFIYCFDDLEAEEDGGMWQAVHHIKHNIEQSFPHLYVYVEHSVVNGWIGQYEFKHHFGIIYAHLPK